jgi:formamidopyrimidine-DNA glycosylase
VPELPEVESLRRDLSETLVGRTFTAVEVLLSKQILTPTGLNIQDIVGHQIEAMRRRAKFLIFDLSDGLAMVFHLRLAGQIVHRDAAGKTLVSGGHPVPAYDAPLPHRCTTAVFGLDDGSTVYLTDIRQFGRVWILLDAGVEELLEQAKLGPEPLDPTFTPLVLRERLARRPKMPLKPLLLDQHVIAGIGNIYADEIIFESRLTPAVRAGQLDDASTMRLHAAIQSVLGMAVREGVAEILNGRATMTRDFPRVHGRKGQPCPVCGTPIVKNQFAGRGTYTCPECQPYAGDGVFGVEPGDPAGASEEAG